MKNKNLSWILNCRVRGLLLALAAITLAGAITIGNGQNLLIAQAQELPQPQPSGMSPNFLPANHVVPRNWTCNATIALTGSSYSYALPSWGMSGGMLEDRQKRCKEAVQADWLNNGKIWKYLGIPAAQQDAFCKAGGTFRVDYGFDERPKEWQFSQYSKPACACVGPFTFQ